MQADPIKPTLKAPEAKRLKQKHDKLDSSFAFNCNLRRYNLMPTERKRWSKRDGAASATDLDEFCYRAALLLPEGWRWDAAWWGGASWNPC